MWQGSFPEADFQKLLISQVIVILYPLNFLVLFFFSVSFRASGVSPEIRCRILYVCPFVFIERIESFYQMSENTSSVEVGIYLKAAGSGVWSSPNFGM